MDSNYLCDYCSKICFPALRAPSAPEIADFLDGKATGVLLAHPGSNIALEKIQLGTLQRMKNDSASCGLCMLFCSIIARQGAVFEFNRPLDDETISFVADPDMAYYGRIRDSRKDKDNPNQWIIRQMRLSAYQQGNDHPIASFQYVLQPCSVGAVSSPLQDQDDAMLFGGRKRELVLDKRLLQKWIRLCENEHRVNCSVTGQYSKAQ